MRKRHKNKPNQTGRNPTSRFARLDLRLLNSPAYRALSVAARALLVELTMLDNGENNGSLFLSIRDAAGRLGMADLTAVRSAFDELQELGFIEMTENASFHVKTAEKSRARCWRLARLARPRRKRPSVGLAGPQPRPGRKTHKRMERGLRTLKAYRKDRDSGRLPVLDSDTLDGN